MADANIKVDPKQLKNYSNNIKTGYKNMYSYLSESKTAVKNLKSTWTGSGSAQEFYSRLMPLSEKCEEVLNVVNTYALTHPEAADVYSANEKICQFCRQTEDQSKIGGCLWLL